MFESKSGVFLIAGLGFFALAFVSNGLIPILMYSNQKELSVEEMIQAQVKRSEEASGSKGSVTLMTFYKDLKVRYKDEFKEYVGEDNEKNLAHLLRLGRKTYIGEGCWHCHSQFVRPVGNEEKRWGPVSKSWEYQNELQRPVLFGTRRIGPDLSREGGRRSNDWHAVHLFKPKLTSPQSVMPEYPWFFDGDPGKPNERGFAIILYMQWLGSWLENYPHYDDKDLK